ncbi:hypothetical protein JOD45_002602 [Scopulibacillus daqui]|uniref:Chemotaxis protein n=1 Tax=Scopulibacillus daqui TaxID=1469162 RepID=A0ABS2Q270_9BACL|nr:chemotaxis protein [Scopulibacillus daqui]MBM7646374.1 hypothetical protein [Scopulibacillus daqui]
MTQKLGIIILHGIGSQNRHFADDFIHELGKTFNKKLSQHTSQFDSELVIKPVFWGKVFENEENKLWENTRKGGKMDYALMREFVIDFIGDAIAYQPTLSGNPNYDKVHAVCADAIHDISEAAGSKTPLFVIAHSLGTVIASNYFYDLQYIPKRISKAVKGKIHHTPIEEGKTLTAFYSLGCPIPLWSLRYTDFDKTMIVPSASLSDYYPHLEGEWLNFYDRDDIFGYPIKTIDKAYAEIVTKDIEVNTGGLLTSWNPLSHLYYFKNQEIINTIAESLVKTWTFINLKIKDLNFN